MQRYSNNATESPTEQIETSVRAFRRRLIRRSIAEQFQELVIAALTGRAPTPDPIDDADLFLSN